MRTALPFALVPVAVLFASNALAAPWADGGALPGPRAQAAIAVDRAGTIHLMGGYNSGANAGTFHDLLFIDGGSGAGAPLPRPIRAAVAATGSDGTIYLVGGYDDGAPGIGELATAYALGLDGGWTMLPDAAVGDASVAAGPGWETAGDVGADGKMYVFGGEGEDFDDAGVNLSYVNGRTLIYDPMAQSWSLGARMPGRRRQHRALRGSDGNIYVMGGEAENNAATNTVFVYHPTTDSWTTGPSIAVPVNPDGGVDAGTTPVVINSFAAAASPDRSFFVIAGGTTTDGNGSPPFFADVYIFDVGMQTWSKYPTPLPNGRRELVAAFGSCSLHVLGGSTGSPVTEHDVVQLISGTTEVCNGKDDDCDGQIDDAVVCSGATGSRCVTDSTTHCGCSTGADCTTNQTCNTTTHLCEASDGGACDGGSIGDGGGTDGGPTGDGGGGMDASTGDDGGSTGGGDGSVGDDAGAGGGDGSSGCGCSLVGGSDTSSLAALGGLGVVAAAVLRSRRRRRG